MASWSRLASASNTADKRTRRRGAPFSGRGREGPRSRAVSECDRCGSPNAVAARFCSVCGAALPERRREGLEVRKTVTILFCDVVGSTALGEATDPETTRRVMTRYAESMAEIVRQHGGTVERFRGDEVMAVFGVPVTHEDDALRAVRTATEMQRGLADAEQRAPPDLGRRARLPYRDQHRRGRRGRPRIRRGVRHRRRGEPGQAARAGGGARGRS